MLDSYFFIPGDKQKFLDKINFIQSEYIVIDLEDAVALQNKKQALNLAVSLAPQSNHFVRIPFFDMCYSPEELIKLIKHFEGRIIVPKLREAAELKKIAQLDHSQDLKMIILVENPICFINLPEILKEYSSQIQGVGFGSHDFCSITGIKHTAEHLAHYKRQLVLYTKAFNVDYIDGVDLNLTDFSEFKKECVFAFEIGCKGKFLIHPSQIEALKDVSYMSQEEIEQLKIVYAQIKDIPEDAIEVYTINGKIYEKPHILRIKYLMKKLEKNNNN